MKKSFALFLALIAFSAFGQTFKVQNLQVLGNATIATPLAITYGGTGASTQGAALTAILGSSTVPIANGGTGASTQPAALTAILGSSAVPIANGGTGATTQPAALTAILGSSTVPIANGGTGAATQPAALTAILGSSTVPITNGGTGAATAPAALTNLGAAPIASPAFTGVPTAPTAVLGTNTTQLATSAFVANHAPCPSIMDFGGKNDGTGDNSTPYLNTIAASTSGQACVYFPAGTFSFSGNVAYTLPSASASITILGAGPEITKLTWSGGGGLTLNYIGSFNAAHIRDLTLLTGSINVGSAIYLHQNASSLPNPANSALSDISNVTIRGADGYAVADSWQYGVQVFGVSNVNFTNLTAVGPSAANSGTGVYIFGTVTLPPVVFNFMGCTFNYNVYGINYGTYTQGVTVSQSNFVGGPYGIVTLTGATGFDQLTVTGSQFNNTSAGILTQSIIENTMIANNLFIVPGSAAGIALDSSGLFSIIGNTFNPGNSPVSPTGISIAGTLAGNPVGVITGNVLFTMGTGIWLKNTSTSATALDNVFYNNGTDVFDQGSGNTTPSNYLSVPPPIGNTTANSGAFTSLLHRQQEIDASYTFNTPTTGQTVTLATGTETALIVPAGTLATLTITLPGCTAGYDGSLARFSSSQAITVLTVNATSGTVVDAPNSLGLGGGNGYLCRGANTSWYRLY